MDMVVMIGRISIINRGISNTNTVTCKNNKGGNKSNDKSLLKGKIMSPQMPKNSLSNTTSPKNTKKSFHQTSYKH